MLPLPHCDGQMQTVPLEQMLVTALNTWVAPVALQTDPKVEPGFVIQFWKLDH